MIIAVASWGSRGEIEPCVAVGSELQRRGHEVRMAVPPDLVPLAESAGLATVAYGGDLQVILDPYRDFWTCLFRRPWMFRQLKQKWREISEPIAQGRKEINATLISLADGADVLFTGMNYEDAAANVAEFNDIRLVVLHWFPFRANGRLVPFVPAPLCRLAMKVFWYLSWLGTKKVEDVQRQELGLPKATAPWPRRIAERGSLELQAYDEVCFPGLAAEWAEWNGRRPFVGPLTLESPTDADDEVAAWIAQGTPPIFFGFGSIPVESPADTVGMISAACERLGERALICSGCSDFSCIPQFDHVKVVSGVNLAAAFPACRAVVHHGGAGTTAVGMRAGLPTLILSTDPNQALWGATVKRLKIGTTRRFSATTQKSLVKDLRTILAPECAIRAREIAARMTGSAESVAVAADLVESFAHSGCTS
ncbi:glycosyltransferase [Mycolicibacterium celeriflavum]|uniref:glycosyltransferase n=1 Tax=Mycolicibacterium celeriflavum TaxID=1249101 RepID=UPI003CEDC6C2